MIKEQSRRRFSREFKLTAVRSMTAGANVAKLARDLGISRKGLYEWRNQFSKGGVTSLRGAGRPMLEPSARDQDEVTAPSTQVQGPTADTLDELARAQTWIAELERPICLRLSYV